MGMMLHMKMWCVTVPVVTECAHFYDYYVEPKEVLTCSKCGRDTSPAPPYIEGEWEVGCDKICDFVFAVGPIIVREAIADELRAKFRGFEKGEVRMPPRPLLMRPEKITKRTKKRVWLPYEGPPICYMKITKEVDLHPRSTVRIERECPGCGIIYKEFVGIEERRGDMRIPRKKGKGLFVRKSALEGCDFFKPKYTGLTLCTDRAKDFMIEKGYSNVDFLEVGDLIRS